MRCTAGLLLLLLVTATASAQTIGNTSPVKPTPHLLSNPASDNRDGGETFADAIAIDALPWTDIGVTCDNIDDYDEICPFDTPGSPDVVYSWVASFDGNIYIDLCHSQYDTKLYVYDSSFELYACNDDYYTDPDCGVYVSYISYMPISFGETYYIVVDGYGGDCGQYNIEIDDDWFEIWPICIGATLFEDEPPLVDGYVDQWNSGCNVDPPVFQGLSLDGWWCGQAGWYDTDGSTIRDTDWYECTASGTAITWQVDAEVETYFIQVAITDCDDPQVVQAISAGPYLHRTMTINTTPGEVVYLFVASTHFSNPGGIEGNEYAYEFEIEGITGTVNTEQLTWGGIKSLFR